MNYLTALLFLGALTVLWLFTRADERRISERTRNQFGGLYEPRADERSEW